MKDKPIALLIRANQNIFNLMAIARRALLANGQLEQSKRMVLEVQQSNTYHEGLNIIGKYVLFGEAIDDE
ncbi:hypothetical protein JCM17380_13330 [Desulfosporosinus burensis]